jgi:arginase
MRLAIIDVPYNSSGLTSGEARSPLALREAGLIDALPPAIDVVDYGEVSFNTPTPDRDPITGIIAPATLAEMTAAVRAAVGRALDDGRVPLVIGGDCPLLLGCLAAARDTHGRVGLIFVDGHEDAWPPHRSPTGEAADMELGLALGFTASEPIAGLTQLLPLVRVEDVVMLGPRDAAELAAADVPTLDGTTTFLDDAALGGIDTAAQTTASLTRRLREDVGQWWFHLDLDVLSSAALPAVQYPQPGGLSWKVLAAVSDAALRMPGLIGWDVTIYNPDLDPDGSGVARIVSFLGAMARRLV